jgi:hypothetical protein
MDAASGSQPARGVTLGKLTESQPDRIIVGSRLFYLRAGTSCTYPLGTKLKVVSTERDGRSYVEAITEDRGLV